MARFYLLACFAGTLLPFAAFGEWITHHGFSPILMITTILQQPLALFAWLDVIVTALVLIIFADIEGRRIGMPCQWVTPLCNLLRRTLTWVTAIFVLPRQAPRLEAISFYRRFSLNWSKSRREVMRI